MSGISFADSNNVTEILPGSNNPNSTITVSSAVTPSVVAISSTVATRIDTALNASLLSALGATYKRASVLFQNSGEEVFYWGYSVAVTTTTGFKLTKNDIRVEKLGRAVPLYCIGGSSGSLKVGGAGWK